MRMGEANLIPNGNYTGIIIGAVEGKGNNTGIPYFKYCVRLEQTAGRAVWIYKLPTLWCHGLAQKQEDLLKDVGKRMCVRITTEIRERMYNRAQFTGDEYELPVV